MTFLNSVGRNLMALKLSESGDWSISRTPENSFD